MLGCDWASALRDNSRAVSSLKEWRVPLGGGGISQETTVVTQGPRAKQFQERTGAHS